MDLSAARALSEDVARLVEGRSEVDALLAGSTPTPSEPDTPVPG